MRNQQVLRFVLLLEGMALFAHETNKNRKLLLKTG
jgi:hypothetical protein